MGLLNNVMTTQRMPTGIHDDICFIFTESKVLFYVENPQLVHSNVDWSPDTQM